MWIAVNPNHGIGNVPAGTFLANRKIQGRRTHSFARSRKSAVRTFLNRKPVSRTTRPPGHRERAWSRLGENGPNVPAGTFSTQIAKLLTKKVIPAKSSRGPTQADLYLRIVPAGTLSPAWTSVHCTLLPFGHRFGGCRWGLRGSVEVIEDELFLQEQSDQIAHRCGQIKIPVAKDRIGPS